MKKLKCLFSVIVTILMILMMITPTMAAGIPVAGAPRMPKGAENLIDLSKVLGNNGTFTYTKDLLISSSAQDNEQTVSFNVDKLDLSYDYVLSFWALIPVDSPDWTGFKIYTNSGAYEQDISVNTNVIYLGQNSQAQAECTNIKIPKGTHFKFDIHFKSADEYYQRNIYINNQPLTNNWGGNGVDMPLPKSDLIVKVGTNHVPIELSSFRLYQVDPEATEFEDVTKPIKQEVQTTTTKKTTTTTKATTTTAAANNTTDSAVKSTTAAKTTAANTDNGNGQDVATQPEGNNVWIVVIIIIVLVLLGGATAIFFILRKPSTDTKEDKESKES